MHEVIIDDIIQLAAAKSMDAAMVQETTALIREDTAATAKFEHTLHSTKTIEDAIVLSEKILALLGEASNSSSEDEIQLAVVSEAYGMLSIREFHQLMEIPQGALSQLSLAVENWRVEHSLDRQQPLATISTKLKATLADALQKAFAQDLHNAKKRYIKHLRWLTIELLRRRH